MNPLCRAWFFSIGVVAVWIISKAAPLHATIPTWVWPLRSDGMGCNAIVSLSGCLEGSLMSELRDDVPWNATYDIGDTFTCPVPLPANEMLHIPHILRSRGTFTKVFLRPFHTRQFVLFWRSFFGESKADSDLVEVIGGENAKISEIQGTRVGMNMWPGNAGSLHERC